MSDRTKGLHSVDGRTILITGGTGSLGKALTRRLLSGAHGKPEKIIVFSRDEAKQHDMRLGFLDSLAATEEVIYQDSRHILEFRIGDVRDYQSISSVLRHADIVVNTAALKQVPNCEYFPSEAVATNIRGATNICKAIENLDLPVKTVIGISTDKACMPVSVMGMTKAIQERIFITANLHCPDTRFVCVRYGNVLASRGSVLPLFHSQIDQGGPVTITTAEMTRFLLPLDHAVDTILAAHSQARRGEVFVPRIPAILILNIAKALINGRDIKIKEVGVRPGEKIHEVLISEDEIYRTSTCNGYFAIRPILPELSTYDGRAGTTIGTEFSSDFQTISLEETRELLIKNGLTIEDQPVFSNIL